MLVLPYFNSIKVRLEPCLVPQAARYGQRFQFHKGTIRTERCRSDVLSSYRFQFHKGTIRTTRNYYAHHNENIFQFHKGTIRTQPAKLHSRLLLHFNSIKVRLEPCIGIALLQVMLHFNSIKVRLERSAGIKFTAKT